MNDAQKILIVDDEENIRRIFKKALEKKNYAVHTAKNAEDALQKIKNQNYLLIFSDIFMDEMSGLTLLKEVKKINPQAKIVVMTAQDTMNNTIEAMRTGAYDYISKPFDFETVYALVDRVEASREVQIPSRSKIEEEIDGHSIRSIVGKNKVMQDIFKTIGKSAVSDLSVLQGPQISRRQQERVLDYIEQGRAEGATVVTGGGRPDHLDRGWYVEPTLFADVDNAMTIAQEEIFGPVLVIIGFDDDDDAVRIANESTYGLSGMITSADLDRAKAVARRIRTGTLGINGGIWYGADAPFGGYKGSGLGRQCGIEGLEIFTETKTVGWPAES